MKSDYKAMKECDLRLREFTVEVDENVLIRQEEFSRVLLRRNGYVPKFV